MGEIFRRNVRESYLDLMDWVDIRPDFNMTWCIAFTGIIGLLVYYLPTSMLIAATIFSGIVALGLLMIGICVAMIYVVVQAWCESRWLLKQELYKQGEVPPIRGTLTRRVTSP